MPSKNKAGPKSNSKKFKPGRAGDPAGRSDSPKGEGFTFVDRSGKVHGRAGGPKPAHVEKESPKLFQGKRFKREEFTGDRGGQSERPEKFSIKFDRGARPQGGDPSASKPLPKLPSKDKFKSRYDKHGESTDKFRNRDEKSDNRSGKRFGKKVGHGGASHFEKRAETFGGRPERSERKTHHHGKDFHGKDHHGKPNRNTRAAGQGGPVKKYKATIDKNRKGFGFIIFESRELEDAFIPPRDADQFFHGDRVEVSVNSYDEVEKIDVLNHRFREIVGKYTPHPTNPTKGGWVVYEQKRTREEVFIPSVPPQFAGKLEAEDWIRVKLTFQTEGPHPVTGEIADVYGKELPPSADVGMIAAEFSLIEEHSAAAELEARSQKLEIPGKDMEGREDLREVPFITIDGETARDFDDAIFVERDKSGYILWVAIADVSHYVYDGTALDQDARSRGTSVYFPERAFHMLPRALSENLCSLRPNEPRLTMVAKMYFDRAGIVQREKTELMEAVIQSKRRATYNEIQAEWDQNKENKSWEYSAHFELYALLRKMRQDRGSIDFDLPEAELKVQPTGEVISIKERARIEAHRLIEEFMIAANEGVTEWIMDRHWPFIYRVHEEPAMDSLEKFRTLAATVGLDIPIAEGTSPKVIAEAVRKIDGHPAQFLLNMALLRSMKQAVYSATHGIHYGLASQAYTHFTSPIRRYPDLVVHRMLRKALRTEKKIDKQPGPEELEKLEQDLVDVAEHCSYRERLASDAERESIKLKQVRAILPHLGKEFDAKINGMIEPGMFAKISDPFCEGLVAKEMMLDDFYQFNEEKMTYVGKRKKRIFKVGDPVRIQVVKADVERRQIDFGLPSDEPGKNAGRDAGKEPARDSFKGPSRAPGRDSGKDSGKDFGKRGGGDDRRERKPKNSGKKRTR
jgi:ribonuclease R